MTQLTYFRDYYDMIPATNEVSLPHASEGFEST